MKTHFHIRCADNQQAKFKSHFASSKVGSGRTLCGFGTVLQWSYSRFIQWMSSVWDPSRDWGFGAFRFDLSVRKLWLPGTVPSTLLQHRGRRCHVSKELKRYAKDKIIEKLEGFFPFVQKIHCLNGRQMTTSFMSNIHAGPKTALTLLLMRSYLLDTEIRIWPGQCETWIVFQVSVFPHQYLGLPVCQSYCWKPWRVSLPTTELAATPHFHQGASPDTSVNDLWCTYMYIICTSYSLWWISTKFRFQSPRQTQAANILQQSTRPRSKHPTIQDSGEWNKSDLCARGSSHKCTPGSPEEREVTWWNVTEIDPCFSTYVANVCREGATAAR